MQNGELIRGFGIGLIILLLGASIIPGMYANVIDVNTADNNITNSKIILTYIIIGKIRDKKKLIEENNYYSFFAIRLFVVEFIDKKFSMTENIFDSYLEFGFHSKIGIFRNHCVYAVFFDVYF